MLEGKTILVSGATGFLGKAICRAAHGYGARLVVGYCSREAEAQAMAEELGGCPLVRLDFRNVAAVERSIGELYKIVPRIDVLVNNASVAQVMPLPMLEESDVDLVFDVNMKGPLFLTSAVVKGMIRNGSGAIVNMGSIAGHRLLDVPVTYAMSKAAISGLTLALAGELKRFRIRVNSIVPGLMDGGVASGVPAELRADFLKHCAVGRAGKAEDVAELACFLASERASYINAQNIFVDGGV